jgi:hypothetical protein
VLAACVLNWQEIYSGEWSLASPNIGNTYCPPRLDSRRFFVSARSGFVVEGELEVRAMGEPHGA